MRFNDPGSSNAPLATWQPFSKSKGTFLWRPHLFLAGTALTNLHLPGFDCGSTFVYCLTVHFRLLLLALKGAFGRALPPPGGTLERVQSNGSSPFSHKQNCQAQQIYEHEITLDNIDAEIVNLSQIPTVSEAHSFHPCKQPNCLTKRRSPGRNGINNKRGGLQESLFQESHSYTEEGPWC